MPLTASCKGEKPVPASDRQVPAHDDDNDSDDEIFTIDPYLKLPSAYLLLRHDNSGEARAANDVRVRKVMKAFKDAAGELAQVRVSAGTGRRTYL